jgi:hypothetical protein
LLLIAIACHGRSGSGEKLKVFISYLRAELAFADELVAGLKYDGRFGVTIDRQLIYFSIFHLFEIVLANVGSLG